MAEIQIANSSIIYTSDFAVTEPGNLFTGEVEIREDSNGDCTITTAGGNLPLRWQFNDAPVDCTKSGTVVTEFTINGVKNVFLTVEWHSGGEWYSGEYSRRSVRSGRGSNGGWMSGNNQT